MSAPADDPGREVRYVNQHLHSFCAWFRDNEPALAERYYALPAHPSCAQEPAEHDFFEFCAEQYQREVTRLEDDR